MDAEVAISLMKLPEISLLKLGIPYDVIQEMDEEDVDRYLALTSAIDEIRQENLNA